MGNWGYITDTQSIRIYASPIYDNASTLFPALSEKAMEKEILPFLLFPKAALTINGTKASYLDILSSGYIPAACKAVRNVGPFILNRMPDIDKFIDDQDFLSDVRKKFYRTILHSRAEYILEPAYKCCISGNYDLHAFERLEHETDSSN